MKVSLFEISYKKYILFHNVQIFLDEPVCVCMYVCNIYISIFMLKCNAQYNCYLRRSYWFPFELSRDITENFSVMGTPSLQPFLKTYWLTPVKMTGQLSRSMQYELERQFNGAFPLHGTVRHGLVQYGSVRVGLHFHCSLVPL